VELHYRAKAALIAAVIAQQTLTSGRKILSEHTVEDLLLLAERFDAMAATAVTQDGKHALEQLATRFRVFAARRASDRQPNGQVAKPGTAALAGGLYELRNAFGTWVGDVVLVRPGELLPRAPHEFTWHLTTGQT
jgi:hypothetical protein